MHAIKVLCFIQHRQEWKTRKNKVSVYFVTINCYFDFILSELFIAHNLSLFVDWSV